MSANLKPVLSHLKAYRAKVLQPATYAKVERAVGMLLEAGLINAPIGSVCFLDSPQGQIPCEIVGFSDERCFLMALGPIQGVQTGSLIRIPGELVGQSQESSRLPKLESMLGRVINGLAQPLDGKGGLLELEPSQAYASINPMARPPVDQTLDTGVCVLNGLLTIGVGQRVGLFAGSGVGKSVFLGMLARHVDAEVVVVGLVGERGREVAEFVQDVLGATLGRSVVVASPADDSAAMRLRAAKLTAQIAESLCFAVSRILPTIEILQNRGNCFYFGTISLALS